MIELRNIEDLTLAMADDEYVSFRTARAVLGTYLARNVTFRELSCVVGRLSNLGLLRWRVRRGAQTFFRTRASVAEQRSCEAFFMATASGLAYLALPRRVSDPGSPSGEVHGSEGVGSMALDIGPGRDESACAGRHE
ncbi:MAG: hypothetical protein ACK5PG_07555 [Lysobacterales bacterium]|jgi:hypothetical protein